MYEQVRERPLDIVQFESAGAAFSYTDVIIDALLGTGAKPPLAGRYRAAVEAMNAAEKPIVAVDLPSGADADGGASELTVQAAAVVTFTATKRWHAYATGADVPTAVVDIGSPAKIVEEAAGSESAQLLTAHDLPRKLFSRKTDGNKGLYGHVLVIGGSLGKAGAPAMAGMAALRSGAGLVTVACPGVILPTVARFSPALMTEPLGGRDAECANDAGDRGGAGAG